MEPVWQVLTVNICSAADATRQSEIFERIFNSRSLICTTSYCNSSSPIVLLLSPALCRSNPIKNEITAAVQSGISIYPVFLHKMELPDWLHFLISSHQWLDASDGNIETAALRIAGKLLLDSDSTIENTDTGMNLKGFHQFIVEQPPNFVGRTSELSILKETISTINASLKSKEPKLPVLVSVKGRAGVGKTSLVSTFLRKTKAEGNNWLSVSAEASDNHIAYMLWARVVAELAGGKSGPDNLKDSLEGCLGRSINDELLEDAALLLPLLSNRQSGTSLKKKELYAPVTDFIADLLITSFHQGSNILFLDNLHWADSGSIEMLGDIIAKLQGTPILIILSYRPERPNGTPVEVPLLENIATKKNIMLEPLKAKESVKLLTRLIDTDSLEKESISAMAETTGGYPLHLELIANARNSQSVTYSQNELSDLQLLIQKNYERLPEGRRLIIQALSVLGGEAPVQLVLDTVSTKPALGKSVLLQNDDFAVRKQSSFSDILVFRHDLFKEAVYDTMGPDSRKNFHLRAAVLLEGIHQSDSRFSGVISKHWKKAGNNQSALDHTATYLNHVNSIFHSTAVLEWADEVEHLIAELGLTEGNADTLAYALAAAEETLGRTGEIPKREETLDRLEKVATRYNLIDRLTSAYCSRGLIRKDQGRYDEAADLVQKSADMAESHNNSYRAACAMGTLASIISDLRDRLEEAEVLYLRAGEVLTNLDAPKDLGKNCLHLGILYTEMGNNQKAIEYLNRASELFKSIEFHYGEAVVLTNQANIYVKMEHTEEALTAMDRSIVLLSKAGDFHSLAITLGNRANLFSSRGDLEYATNEYRKAIELHMQADNSRSEKKSRCNLADCLRKRGLFDSALEELEKADRLNEHSGDSYWKARILNGRGRALLENGQYKQASKALQSSLAISHKEKYEALKRSTLIGLAMTAFLSSNHTAAEEYCSLVLATVDEDRRDTQLLEANIIMTDVMVAAGNHSKAVEYSRQANGVAKTMKKPLLDVAAAAAKGRVLQAMENTVQSNLLLKNAAAIADKHGYGDLFWFRGIEEFRQLP